MNRFLLLLIACLLLAFPSFAQDDDVFAQWNQPVEPFQIAGNLYYVGTNEIASYLIAGSEGHVLIDGGLEETAPIILNSVATLGFDIKDVKILLNTHAHFDHAAGLAALKEASGAEVWISEGDADIVERGGKDDYLLGNDGLFPPVKVDNRFSDLQEVSLGDIEMTARITAGHTRGCTSWTMQVEDDGAMLDVVLTCSFSILPMARLLNDPSYQGIAEDYRKTFETLEALPCDIFLSPHGQFINLTEKRAAMKTADTNVFIDPALYEQYVQRGKATYRKRLEKERAEAGG